MKTQFIEVPLFGEKFVQMQEFARTFDHCIDPLRNAKLISVSKNDKVFGYVDVVYLPIAFPAFHPDLTSPRGVVETMEGWRSHGQFANAGETLIGVPLAEDRKTFPEHQLISLGFQRMKRELYYTNISQ